MSSTPPVVGVFVAIAVLHSRKANEKSEAGLKFPVELSSFVFISASDCESVNLSSSKGAIPLAAGYANAAKDTVVPVSVVVIVCINSIYIATRN